MESNFICLTVSENKGTSSGHQKYGVIRRDGHTTIKWGVEPGQIPSLESQAPAEPRPFKKVRARALTGTYLLLQFLGPFQKVNPKPGSSLSHSGPGPPSAQKVEKSWKTLIWCLPLFWVKWLKPIIHILLWWNFFELSCRMKSKKIHIKVETHLEAYFLRLFIFCLGTSPHKCEQCFSLLWNMNDENNQI